jgi:AraC-like DNA-binding protein
MIFEEGVEFELRGEWETIQRKEADVYVANPASRTILTTAPFFDCRTFESERYVVIHELSPPAPPGNWKGGLASWQVKRAKQIMAIQRRPSLSVAQIALACGITESHFVREFKKSTGVTPHQWAMVQRVRIAQELLRQTRLSLERVAIGSDFFDQSHLSRWFKRVVGMSPRAWQRAHAPRPGSKPN